MRTRAYERALAEANKAFQEPEDVRMNPEILLLLLAFTILSIPFLLLI